MKVGICVTLFEEDILESFKHINFNELELCHFKVNIALIQNSDSVRFVDNNSRIYKIFKERFYIG